MQEVREISLSITTTTATPARPAGRPAFLEHSALIIGIIFYITGTAAYVGITVAFFMLRMYAVSSDSRIGFFVLFIGMFIALQGLIAILVARGGNGRRPHEDYLLNHMTALYSHGVLPCDGERISAPD